MATNVDELETGQRWLLGGGLGIGMFCLWAYAMLFRTEGEETLILPKRFRISMRLVLAVVITALPAGYQSLDTTEFMAVLAGLFVFLTVWETIGGLSKGASFFEPWTHSDATLSEELLD
jgi:hypothetical protein